MILFFFYWKTYDKLSGLTMMFSYWKTYDKLSVLTMVFSYWKTYDKLSVFNYGVFLLKDLWQVKCFYNDVFCPMTS